MRCFLCRQKNQPTTLIAIDSSTCPASKKTLRSIISHLSGLAGIELHIPAKEWICNTCFRQIADYDTCLVRTVRKKEELTRLIEKSLIAVDSDFEEECESDMVNFDAELNELNFMEGIVVSDNEIDEAIKEAAGIKRKHVDEKNFTGSKQLYMHNPFNCNVCSMSFRSKVLFLKHMNQAHKKYSCELCDYSHRNEDYVLLHQNLHEGKNENQCRYCDKEFTTKISTIRHMEAHLDTKKYQCDKCGLCFSQTTVLYNHKLQHEAEEKPLRCEICNQIFKTKRTYRHHLITHKADRPRYTCEHCNRTFTEKYTLKVHKRTHHDDDDMQPPPIKKERRLKHEEIELISEEVSAAEAIVVNEAYRSYGEAASNANTATSVVTTNKFDCIICGQPFANRVQMNKHMERDHDVIHNLSFSNSSQFEIVTDEAIKSCQICEQMFQTQTDLDYHLESIHGFSFK